MNVVMIRARMLRIPRKHRLQSGDDFCGSRVGLAIEAPEFPGVYIHERLGKHRLRVEIVGKLPGDGAHRTGIRGEDRALIRWVQRHCPRITGCKGADECAFYGTRAAEKLSCSLESLEGDLCPRLRHYRLVVVGTDRQCDSPKTHRAARIDLSRTGK